MNRQSLTCPHCHKALKTKQPIVSGKRIKCPACHQPFVVGPVPEEDGDPKPSADMGQPSTDATSLLDPSLARFVRWAGIVMMATGVFWAAVPSILILAALVAIPGFHLYLVCIGILLVFLAAPLLLAGFGLYREKPGWFVLPGCIIAFIVGLATVGWVMLSLDGLLNEFKGFPPPDFAGKVGMAMAFATLLLGPLSMLSGIGGLAAFVRAKAAKSTGIRQNASVTGDPTK